MNLFTIEISCIPAARSESVGVASRAAMMDVEVVLSETPPDRPPHPVARTIVENVQYADIKRQSHAVLSGNSGAPESMALARNIGSELGNILFAGAVGERLNESVGRLDVTTPIRLGLSIDNAPLASLPWEFAHFEDKTRHNPLRFQAEAPRQISQTAVAVHPRVRFYRRSLKSPPNRLPKPHRPLSVLIAWADPGSGDAGMLTNIAHEVKAIKKQLKSLGRLVALEDVHEAKYITRLQLEQWLRRTPPDILHFIGHGASLTSGSALLLHGASKGEQDILYAKDFAQYVAGTGVRLIVLSACYTFGGNHHEAGIAEELANAGVPAVVAHNGKLADNRAAAFNRLLYASFTGECSLEDSCWEARQALEHAGPEWGFPVLITSDQPGTPFITDLWQRPAPFAVPYSRDDRFVGRTDVIAQVEELLKEKTQPRIALSGISGLGKTWTATEIAHRQRDQFPGGVFWAEATDVLNLRKSYARMGMLYFDLESVADPDLCAERFREKIESLPFRSLLVLNNVKDTAVLKYLPRHGNCCVLATSQLLTLYTSGFEPIEMKPLKETDAFIVLQHFRRADTAEEKSAVHEIVRLAGYHPYALRLAADQTHPRYGCTFARYLLRLKDRSAFRATRPDGKSHFDAIDVSWQRLQPPACQVLATASWLAATDIPVDIVERACEDLTSAQFEAAILELLNSSLLTREWGENSGSLAEETFAVHEIVRAYCQDQPPPDLRMGAVRSIARIIAESLSQANQEQNWSDARGCIAHARAVIEGLRNSFPDMLAEREALLRPVAHCAALHGETREALSLLYETRGIVEQTQGVNSLEAAWLLRECAWLHQRLYEGKMALRCARHAFFVARRLYPRGDHRMAEYYHQLGYVLKKGCRYRSAAALYQKALALNRAAGEDGRGRLIESLNDIGMLQIAINEAEAALLNLNEALHLRRQMHGAIDHDVGVFLNNIGQALVIQNRWEEALSNHQQALSIFHILFDGNHPDAATSHYYIGEAYVALGRRTEALSAFNAALPLYERFYGAEDRRPQTVRRRIADLGS